MNKQAIKSVSGIALIGAVPGWAVADLATSPVAAGIFAVIAWMALVFLVGASIKS